MGKTNNDCTRSMHGANAPTTPTASAPPCPGRGRHLITNGHVPDSVYEEVPLPHFTEKELSDLTLAVATINAWNRLAIAGRPFPELPGSPSPSSSKKGP